MEEVIRSRPRTASTAGNDSANPRRFEPESAIRLDDSLPFSVSSFINSLSAPNLWNFPTGFTAESARAQNWRTRSSWSFSMALIMAESAVSLSGYFF